MFQLLHVGSTKYTKLELSWERQTCHEIKKDAYFNMNDVSLFAMFLYQRIFLFKN